jgi:hypothetical protein
MNDSHSLPLPFGLSEPAPDLAEIIDAWPSLSGPIRAGILAMVRVSANRK